MEKTNILGMTAAEVAKINAQYQSEMKEIYDEAGMIGVLNQYGEVQKKWNTLTECSKTTGFTIVQIESWANEFDGPGDYDFSWLGKAANKWSGGTPITKDDMVKRNNLSTEKEWKDHTNKLKQKLF
jgi:hypothetical protein